MEQLQEYFIIIQLQILPLSIYYDYVYGTIYFTILGKVKNIKFKDFNKV